MSGGLRFISELSESQLNSKSEPLGDIFLTNINLWPCSDGMKNILKLSIEETTLNAERMY